LHRFFFMDQYLDLQYGLFGNFIGESEKL